MKDRRRVLRALRDYIELLLIPGLSIFLPWWLTIRLYRLLAYVPFLYRASTLPCLAGAKALDLLKGDEKAWIRACKVGLMVDLADPFLVLFRGKAFMKRYIKENIYEQLQEQQIIFVPHFGAGMFLYKMLQQENINVALIGNDFPRNYSAVSLISQLRLYALTKMGTTTIWNDNMMGVRQVLRDKQTLLILPDVPRSYGWQSYPIETQIGQLNIASRYFSLAEKRHIPVMNAIMGLDIVTGNRQFKAEIYDKTLSAQEYAQCFAELATQAIVEQSYLWRMLVVGEDVLLVEKNQQDDN